MLWELPQREIGGLLPDWPALVEQVEWARCAEGATAHNRVRDGHDEQRGHEGHCGDRDNRPHGSAGHFLADFVDRHRPSLDRPSEHTCVPKRVEQLRKYRHDVEVLPGEVVLRPTVEHKGQFQYKVVADALEGEFSEKDNAAAVANWKKARGFRPVLIQMALIPALMHALDRIKTASEITRRNLIRLFNSLAAICFLGRYAAIAWCVDRADGA